jgi:signal transduction histidine kinase
VPVYDGGRIIGLLMTARDITVLKQYQEQLIQSQKMEDLGKLAGGVAHEINNPLGIILGYAQLLMEDAEPGGQLREDLATIERQAKVCRKIVADLLGFSRRIESTRSELDLNGSILDVVSLVGHTFRQEWVIVDTRLDKDIPPIVGDAAIGAFERGGRGGRIIVSTKLCKHRSRVLVTVADTGAGIGQEALASIFDPFFTTKPPGSGTGLGLSVSFGIVKDHGGRISAISPAPIEYLRTEESKGGTSPPGPGTVFIVELPLTADGLPEDDCPELARRETDPA